MQQIARQAFDPVHHEVDARCEDEAVVRQGPRSLSRRIRVRRRVHATTYVPGSRARHVVSRKVVNEAVSLLICLRPPITRLDIGRETNCGFRSDQLCVTSMPVLLHMRRYFAAGGTAKAPANHHDVPPRVFEPPRHRARRANAPPAASAAFLKTLACSASFPSPSFEPAVRGDHVQLRVGVAAGDLLP